MIPWIPPGEVLQRYFHALVDFSAYAKKHQQAFLAPLLGMVVVLVYKPSLPMYPLFLAFFSFYSFPMEQPTIQNLSAPKGEFVEPPQPLKRITTSSYELCPGFIAMVQEQAFSELDYENPYIIT